MPDRYRQTEYEPRQGERYRYEEDDRWNQQQNRGGYQGGEYRGEERFGPWEGYGREEGGMSSMYGSRGGGRSMEEARRASDYMEGRRNYGGSMPGTRNDESYPWDRREGGNNWQQHDYPGGYRPGQYGYGEDYSYAESGPSRSGRSQQEDWRRQSGQGSRDMGQGNIYGMPESWYDDGRSYGQSGSRYGKTSQYGEYRGGQSGQYGNYGASQTSQYGSYGEHSGKGPKGWKRTDDRIKEEVCERLCDAGDVDASNIDVSVSNGEVTLKGMVNDRSQKRAAEDAICELSGVMDVNNQLRVGSMQSSSPSTSTSMASSAKGSGSRSQSSQGEGSTSAQTSMTGTSSNGGGASRSGSSASRSTTGSGGRTS